MGAIENTVHEVIASDAVPQVETQDVPAVAATVTSAIAAKLDDQSLAVVETKSNWFSTRMWVQVFVGVAAIGGLTGLFAFPPETQAHLIEGIAGLGSIYMLIKQNFGKQTIPPGSKT